MHHHNPALPPGYPLSPRPVGSPHPAYPYSPHGSVVQVRERGSHPDNQSPNRVSTSTQAAWQSPPIVYPQHPGPGYIPAGHPPDPIYVVRQQGGHSSRKDSPRRSRKSRRDDSAERNSEYPSSERSSGYVDRNGVYQTYTVVERHSSYLERRSGYPNYGQERLQTVDPRDLGPSYSQQPTPVYHQHSAPQGMSDDPDVQFVSHVHGRGTSIDRETKSSRRSRESSRDRHHYHPSHAVMHSNQIMSPDESIQFDRTPRSHRQQSPDCASCVPEVRRKSKSSSKSHRSSPNPYILPATPGNTDRGVSPSYGQRAPSFSDLSCHPSFPGHDSRRSDVNGRGPTEPVWSNRGQQNVQLIHSRGDSGERVMPGQIDTASISGPTTQPYASQQTHFSVAGVQPAGAVSLVTGSSLTNDQAFSQQIILVDSLGQSSSLQCVPVMEPGQQQIITYQTSGLQDLTQILDTSTQQVTVGTDPSRNPNDSMGAFSASGAQLVSSDSAAMQSLTTFTSDSSVQTQTQTLQDVRASIGGQTYVRRLSGDFNQAQLSLVPPDNAVQGQIQSGLSAESGLLVQQNTSVGDAIISQAFSLQHLFDDTNGSQPQSSDQAAMSVPDQGNISQQAPMDLTGLQGMQVQQASFEVTGVQQTSLEANSTQSGPVQQIQLDPNAIQGVQDHNSSAAFVTLTPEDMMLLPSVEQHQVFVLEPPGSSSQTRPASISGTRRSSWHTPEHSINGSVAEDEDPALVIDLSTELADEDDVIFTSSLGEQQDNKALIARANSPIAELGEHGLRIASVFSLATSRRTRRTMSDSVLQEVEVATRQTGATLGNVADTSVVSNGRLQQNRA
ncbi:hypothetical protein BaRGS_00030908 [Batillaria attramentaria]|uniref:Uncharacterized protein n=1 Tax=Batillaria attramentaria TaxID=370345 RepID=A0ABD0JRY0_9CAEN